MQESEDNFEDEERAPSKSQVKRECDALQKLGEKLLQLNSTELEKIILPERLAHAIHEGRKLQARGALKRQRQYIGKLMRDVDSESIIKQLEVIRHQHDFHNAQFKQAEQWRDRLVDEDPNAMSELIELYPDLDRQHVNQLVRLAKRELDNAKPPVSKRKLFKYLHELGEQRALGTILQQTDKPA